MSSTGWFHAQLMHLVVCMVVGVQIMRLYVGPERRKTKLVLKLLGKFTKIY